MARAASLGKQVVLECEILDSHCGAVEIFALEGCALSSRVLDILTLEDKTDTLSSNINNIPVYTM
jgi:hypothetical protein